MERGDEKIETENMFYDFLLVIFSSIVRGYLDKIEGNQAKLSLFNVLKVAQCFKRQQQRSAV